jgi:hypothetical protein
MGLHPDVASGPETYAFEALAQLLAAIERRGRRGQGLVAAGYLDQGELHALCAQWFRAAVARNAGGRAYFLEKTPLNTAFVEVIDALFPAAPILHLVRDGRDATWSMLTAGRERKMHLPDTLRGCAERWRAIEAVLRFGRAHPERYCEIRYEDALADLRGTLVRIFAFLALPLPDGVLAQMCAVAERAVHPSRASHQRGYRGKWREGFSADDVHTFKQIAGDLLIELGYERDADW